MSTHPASGTSVSDPFLPDDDKLFNRFLYDELNKGNRFPGRHSRSVSKDPFQKFDRKRPSSGSRFFDNLKNFTPGLEESGEDILQRLKDQLRKEGDMFFYSHPDRDNSMHSRRAEDGDDWGQKGFEDWRSRHHPMFRMPPWMSDDDDVSNLASRMSQSPHFSSMGRRGGPWRERTFSGGAPEGDSVDGPNFERSFHTASAPNAVRIPIRIEAEAPPGFVPPKPNQEASQSQQDDMAQDQNVQATSNEPQHQQPPVGSLQKQPQYASRTNPSIDALKHDDVSRNTRCSSAPPNMSDPLYNEQRFVSKATFPQPTNEKSFPPNTDFNNVAKPFVSPHKAQDTTPAPYNEEESTSIPPQNQQRENLFDQNQQYPQGQQFPQNYQQQQQQQQQQHQPPPPHYQQQQQQQQQPPQQQQQPQHWDNSGHKSSVVRTIPIIFEGRNSGGSSEHSSMPSRSPPQFQQQPQQPPPPPPPQPPRSQWESPFHGSHFGFGPSHGFPDDPFFNFSSGSHPSPSFYHQEPPQQYQKPQQPQQPQHQQNYQPQQTHQPPPPQPQQQQQQPPPTQPKEKSPQPEPKDIKMDKIATVRSFVTEMQERVDKFEGNEKNKEFLYLDEMLTRSLIQLDNIDPDGRDDVRQVRRTLIKDINNTISKLEQKLKPRDDKNPVKASSEGDQKLPEEVEAPKCDGGEKESPQNQDTVEPEPKNLESEPVPTADASKTDTSQEGMSVEEKQATTELQKPEIQENLNVQQPSGVEKQGETSEKSTDSKEVS